MVGKNLKAMFLEPPVRVNGNIMYSNIPNSEVIRLGKLEFRNVVIDGETMLESQFLDYVFRIKIYGDSVLKGQEPVTSFKLESSYRDHYFCQYIFTEAGLNHVSDPVSYLKTVFRVQMEKLSSAHFKKILEE